MLTLAGESTGTVSPSRGVDMNVRMLSRALVATLALTLLSFADGDYPAPARQPIIFVRTKNWKPALPDGTTLLGMDAAAPVVNCRSRFRTCRARPGFRSGRWPCSDGRPVRPFRN